jgi:5-enolpyruvylshikimate-3-phosphate synthase
MSFLIAGLRAKDGVEVSSGGMVDTSYPGFYSRLLALVSSR